MKTQDSEITRRDFLGSTAGILATPWLGSAAAKAKVAIESTQRRRIEAALPTKPFVPPRRLRKLLIFDLNVGYGGHRSIPTANLAFTLMGEKTGAFETVISRDPSIFKPESLRGFDAVFLNKEGKVIKALPSFKPFRFSPILFNASLTIELPESTLQLTRTKPGDIIKITN